MHCGGWQQQDLLQLVPLYFGVTEVDAPNITPKAGSWGSKGGKVGVYQKGHSGGVFGSGANREGPHITGTSLQEALCWASACHATASPTSSVEITDPRTALKAGRVAFSLSQLQALRPGQGNGLSSRLIQNPDAFLAEIGLGLHLAAHALLGATRPPATPFCAPSAAALPVQLEAESVKEKGPLVVGVIDAALIQPLDAVRSDLIGRYVGLRGTIVRTSNVQPLLTGLHFVCEQCQTEVVLPAIEGRFDYPKECPRHCNFAQFALRRDSCEAIDWQRVRLQEDFSDMTSASSTAKGGSCARRMPKTLDCDLKRSLVCSCVPGDAVVIYGVVRCMPATNSAGKSGEGKSSALRALYTLYIEAKAILNSRRGADGTTVESNDDFTPLQLDFIREVHSEPERLPLLVASFCPHIYGQPLVKAALLLSLLGGVPIYAAGVERRLRRRGDIHVLLLGDPGLGKSELLRALARLNRRGVYICGNSCTAAGLTASVVRDPSGEFALEAGALILADNGICCIDEFDKMGTDQQSLLEAMEQQTVSIAKAGIVCTLPARTTVVAAANPCKGKFDMSLNITQNLKGVMSEALLSRFDVVFLMRDEASSKDDQALARHIVRTRSGNSAAAAVGGDSASVIDWAAIAPDADLALANRCRALTSSIGSNGLPTELLATYIRYAKRYAHPRLSKGARECIKEFYLKRRNADHRMNGHLPVTPRQLEALVRLSEARARAELRREVLRSDAEDVIEIVTKGTDSVIEQLPEVAQRKGKAPLNQVVSRIREALERRSKGGQKLFSTNELRTLAGTSITEQIFDRALQKLNMEDNVLIIAGGGNYRYAGASW